MLSKNPGVILSVTLGQQKFRLYNWLMKRCCGLISVVVGLATGGCYWAAEVNGAFATNLPSSDWQNSGAINVRGSITRLVSSYVAIGGDIQVARLRFMEDSGRVGAIGGGMYLAVGDQETILGTFNLGVSILDFSWGDEDGWGMFSPYSNLGGAVRFGRRSLLWLTFHVGLEYEVRFAGPDDGLYLNAGIGIAISDLFRDTELY